MPYVVIFLPPLPACLPFSEVLAEIELEFAPALSRDGPVLWFLLGRSPRARYSEVSHKKAKFLFQMPDRVFFHIRKHSSPQNSCGYPEQRMGFPLQCKIFGTTFGGLDLKITNSENLQHFDSDPLKYIVILIIHCCNVIILHFKMRVYFMWEKRRFSG